MKNWEIRRSKSFNPWWPNKWRWRRDRGGAKSPNGHSRPNVATGSINNKLQISDILY